MTIKLDKRDCMDILSPYARAVLNEVHERHKKKIKDGIYENPRLGM